jgi:hypothetical protein
MDSVNCANNSKHYTTTNNEHPPPPHPERLFFILTINNQTMVNDRLEICVYAILVCCDKKTEQLAIKIGIANDIHSELSKLRELHGPEMFCTVDPLKIYTKCTCMVLGNSIPSSSRLRIAVDMRNDITEIMRNSGLTRYRPVTVDSGWYTNKTDQDAVVKQFDNILAYMDIQTTELDHVWKRYPNTI